MSSAASWRSGLMGVVVGLPGNSIASLRSSCMCKQTRREQTGTEAKVRTGGL